MANFTVYHGKFICHECKSDVRSLRLYPETKTATWMCPNKHLSTVKFGKQKYKVNDREE
jgi:hypothetical protein